MSSTSYLAKFGIGGTHLGNYVPGFKPSHLPPVPCVCCGTMHDGQENGPCELCERNGCNWLTVQH